MKTISVLLLLAFTSVVSGQDILDEYVNYGLSNNLALKQRYAGYQKSLEALREAKGLFSPEINLGARYTVSEGGRTITFPVGNLLNSVYSTLNTLTASAMFPQVENQEIRFLRPTEHETRLRITQPVFNPDIYYNAKIRKEMTSFQEADYGQYRRELISEIKKGYYNVAMSHGILATLIETRKLLSENVRVSRSLIENEKATRDVLYRSQAELDKMDQEIQKAEKVRRTAVSWFNFLLNKTLTDTVIISNVIRFPSITDLTDSLVSLAPGRREEIRKLESYSDMAELQIKRGRSDRLPEMFVAVDYGFQGEKYQFNREQDYMQASAVLSWKLFDGFQTRSRISQSKIEKDMIDARLEEAKKQIELEVINVLNDLRTAEKGISAAESRLANAKEAHRLMHRKYGEGQASLLEYLDARTGLTQADINLIISRYAYLSCYAELEKVSAMSKY